ncbi:MAG: hypothetical protein KGI28_05705 [Thaumarchaeota archaeon]|nr:hypothetical protein [Nitrososphaerota archaeon]
MSWSRSISILVVIGMLSIGLQYSFAIPSLEISTSKQVYEYGDLLSIIFHVSELTGDQITLHIVDSSGKTSAPINQTIDNLNSSITAVDPFDKIRFRPGIYHITAEYSGVNATTSFSLIDSGKIGIPNGFKSIVNAWKQGTPTDYECAVLIRALINNGLINVPNYNNQTNQIHIPTWFKNIPGWWSENLISDNEFGSSIQYLIQKGIIAV